MIWQLSDVLAGLLRYDPARRTMLLRKLMRGYIALRNVQLATQWNLTCLAGTGYLQGLSLDGLNYAPRTGDGFGVEDYGDRDHSAVEPWPRLH